MPVQAKAKRKERRQRIRRRNIRDNALNNSFHINRYNNAFIRELMTGFQISIIISYLYKIIRYIYIFGIIKGKIAFIRSNTI